MRAGQKWQGKSTYQLRTKMEEQSSIAKALRVVQQQMQAASQRLEGEIQAELVRLLALPGVTDPEYVVRAWSLDCPNSPTGLCIYYTKDDPDRDECLFCAEPLDRG